jgi:hypothetical protein
MTDVVLIAVIVAFFTAAAFLVRALDRLVAGAAADTPAGTEPADTEPAGTADSGEDDPEPEAPPDTRRPRPDLVPGRHQ